MSVAAVEAINVSKNYDKVQAVKKISLTVGEGEFFSLLGPSGCGKTTLLRMIAGFETPSSGQVLIGGKDMSSVPPHKRPVNMVFQNYALFPHLSVFDNVAFGLKTGDAVPRAEITRRVEEALALVRLSNLGARYPRELSGGQQQRIAFARAIVKNPYVLLLDEPLSALDPRIREEMQTELARFKKELGITFIMVTHDQSEAFALSDKIAVFNAGLIEQVGSPEEIYEHPRSAFVADFVGQTNVLPGRVVQKAGTSCVVEIGQELRLVAAAPDWCKLVEGDKCVVWVRHDDIDLLPDSNDPLDQNSNTVSGVVLHRSYQGNCSEYILQCAENKLTALVDNEHLSFDAGDTVSMRVAHHLTRVLPA